MPMKVTTGKLTAWLSNKVWFNAAIILMAFLFIQQGLAKPDTVNLEAQQVCNQANTQSDAPMQRYVFNGFDEVYDKKTSLIWHRCLLGQAGTNCQEGTAQVLNWLQALEVGSTQGWRVPNIRELATLVELQCSNPAINLSVFPNQPNGHLWSSSPYHFYDHYAWYLDLADGIYIYGDRQDRKHLRLVKDAE